MSRVPHAASVTPEQRSERPRAHADRPVVIFAAEFPLRTDARRGEDLLGRLCADGVVDVLDGAVVDWPSDAPTPRWHPLQNLPRLAALTKSAWATAISQPNVLEPGSRGLPPLTGALTRGSSSLVAICITDAVDHVHDQLTQAGAKVRVTAISTELYDQLRRAHKSG